MDERDERAPVMARAGTRSERRELEPGRAGTSRDKQDKSGQNNWAGLLQFGEHQPNAAQGYLVWGNGANIVVWASFAQRGRSCAHLAASDRSTTDGPVYRAIELLSLSALGLVVTTRVRAVFRAVCMWGDGLTAEGVVCAPRARLPGSGPNMIPNLNSIPRIERPVNQRSRFACGIPALFHAEQSVLAGAPAAGGSCCG